MKFYKFLFILFVFSSFQACKKSTSQQSNVMKQQSYADYEKDWAEVEKMEKKGLGNSIISKIDTILEKAVEDQNTPQIFKSLAYRSRYYNKNLEDSNLKIFNQFEAQIKTAKFPLKQLLHSASAELYHQYYQRNRWEFQNRTQTNSFELMDLRTWSLQDVLNKIDFHYQASITEKDNALSYPIQNLNEILNASNIPDQPNKKNGLSTRPSLYDFLAHRALLYYQQNEGRVSTPQDEFKVDHYDVLSSTEKFIELNFISSDSASNQLKTAKIYQELLASRLKLDNPEALITLDLQRLRHYYTTSKKEKKDSLYLAALTALSAKFSTSEHRAEIEYQKALLYFEKGRNYSSNQVNDEKRWLLKEAHSICNTYSNQSSFGGIQCLQLKQQIEKRTLEIYTEKVYLPNGKIDFKVQAKNTDSIYFRLLKIPNKMEGHLNNHEKIENYIERLNNLKADRTWVETPTNPGDFHLHSYLFSTEKLGFGRYLLISSTTKKLNLYKDEISIAEFTISELSFISKAKNDNGSYVFQLLNRESGKLVSNAQAVLYKQSYNYTYKIYAYKKVGGYQSDKNGQIKVITAERENFRVQISKGKDTLNGKGSYYYRYSPQPQKKRLTTHFFTDRAIYRPGQTVYFKGIVINQGENEHDLEVNYSSEVILYNKNREKISALKVKTNDYGSFEGSFVLPTSGLNGNYRISEKSGNTYFSVEEYKRPTFEVNLDTLKTTPKINSNVTLNGNTKAFSGANISDATVKYRVTRRVYLPYWSRYFKNTETKEIANGEIKSDTDGKFTIDFFAEADQSIQQKWNPNYSFEITIDATSLSGETQSLTERIKLGSKAYYLSTNLEEKVQQKAINDLIIYAKNIEGIEVNKKLTVKLHRLKAPKLAKKKNYWSTIEYRDNEEVNKDSNELENYEKGETLLSGKVTANKKSDLIGQLPIGAYEIEIISSAEISLKKRFVLFDGNSTKLAIPSFSNFVQLNNDLEPTENAEFLIGTSLTNVNLLFEVEANGKIINSKWINLSNEQQKISIPIKESYRGGFEVRFIGIKSNRVIRKNFRVNVPYTNKELKLELGTYRNKVEPGSKEKWTMTISGANEEKLAAELLAGMYDQSLDQFKTDKWNLNLYRSNYSFTSWKTDGTFGLDNPRIFNARSKNIQNPMRYFPSLNWFGLSMDNRLRFRNVKAYSMSATLESAFEGVMEDEVEMDATNMKMNGDAFIAKNERETNFDKETIVDNTKDNSVPIRTDFRETAFFYPQLRTDANGKISFEFEMPDALTKWKFRALAHTKDLKVGETETTIQTQKKLMVNPTFPRFFREGDVLNLKVLLSNLSDKNQSGIAKIRFFDAFTNAPININKGNSGDEKFSILAGNNSTASWKIEIPKGIQAIKYQVTAQASNFSDGEEKVIPVLSNRKLVTETLPLTIRGNESKNFSFEKLQNNQSSTLVNHSFSLEFTTNPIWYAVQALPYVAEGSSECSEQVFARLYANLLAEKIANSNPRIKEIINLWKGSNSKELTSKLMQNLELKSILIEETPWLQQAKSETEQKKRIAMLFDLNKMADEKKSALNKLKQLQLQNGGWSWYKGMRDNRYITQYIINGFGHLKQLGVDLTADAEMSKVIAKGLKYLDNRIAEDYANLLKNKRDLSKNNLEHTQIIYLYTRSFFLEEPFATDKKAFNYYLKQAEDFWLNENLQLKGMIALTLNRFKKESDTPSLIVASLKDNALQNDNLGMYWKENQSGYYWYNSAIETQALMVEVFQEIAQDKKAVDELRVWLLKQKQTQMWPTSKSTALACYALLIGNNKALTAENKVEVIIANKIVQASKTEAGTGYFKEVWLKEEVNPKLGKISVSKKNDGIAWGAAYWQYYEDLNKITSSSTEEFSLAKTMFKVTTSEKGETMTPIDINKIKIGDKIRIRLRIESKRDLEFVHLKDMRASGFEPINVLSRYKYQDGLGYYESTKDASTNFFMDRLNKGVYVFEYDLRATVAGKFSNGISTIQCQYAPEFASHSKGRLVVITE